MNYNYINEELFTEGMKSEYSINEWQSMSSQERFDNFEYRPKIKPVVIRSEEQIKKNIIEPQGELYVEGQEPYYSVFRSAWENIKSIFNLSKYDVSKIKFFLSLVLSIISIGANAVGQPEIALGANEAKMASNYTFDWYIKNYNTTHKAVNDAIDAGKVSIELLKGENNNTENQQLILNLMQNNIDLLMKVKEGVDKNKKLEEDYKKGLITKEIISKQEVNIQDLFNKIAKNNEIIASKK